MSDFVITSGDYRSLSDFPLEHICDVKSYRIFGRNDDFKKIGDLTIYIEGYVLPRRKYFDTLSRYNQYELIAKLYFDYGKGFISLIKGNFIIILINKDEISIFNDINSIQKFFIINRSAGPLISNNVLLINLIHKLEFNPLYPTIQALFQHPVKGITMFKDLYYSEYATMLILQNEMRIERYWTPISLIGKERKGYSINDLISLFRQNIDDHIKYFKPNTISLTLTGGRDTRSVLAALLSLNIFPHAFTFGDSEGTDVIIAKKICSRLNLQFSNHYIEDLSKETYEKLINEINLLGNPLIHLHRSHRLDAIRKEKSTQGKIDMLFVGSMGGDFIKGVSFNDYIVTEFIRSLILEGRAPDLLVKEILTRHFVNFSADKEKSLIELIDNLEYLDKHDFKKTEFLLAHSFVGALHDSQDLFVFSKYSTRVVAPFMDIDFLESLFQSEHSLFSNSRSSVNPFLKLKGGEFQARLIMELYEPLAYLPLANWYKPSDILDNQYLYLVKRLIYRFFRPAAKETFSYKQWFNELIASNLSFLPNEIRESYNMDEIHNGLRNSEHDTTEGYWHKYSNILVISKWIELLRSETYAGSNFKK